MTKCYVLLTVIFIVISSSVCSQESDSLRDKFRPKHPQDVKNLDNPLIKPAPAKTKRLSFNVLGYVKLLGTVDWGNVQNTSEFITSEIPIYPKPREKSVRSSFDPRQTRIALEGFYQVKENKKLRIYIETDFYNSEPIVDFRLHLRYAYIEYGKFLIGQNWSTAFNIDAVPNQVDFEGPNSLAVSTNGQIRYTHLQDKFSFAIAIETHLEDFTPYDAVDEVFDFQSIPDLIAYAQTQGNWGNVRLTGIFRNIDFTNPTNSGVDHLFGWGVNFTGYTTFLKRKRIFDAFYWGFIYGKGIAFYIDDISGMGLDAVPDKNGVMQCLPAHGSFVAYKHAWGPRMESNIIASYVKLDNTNINNDLIFDETLYGAVNLMYNPFDRINLGIEFLRGKNVNKKQDFGEGYRIQIMSQFNF